MSENLDRYHADSAAMAARLMTIARPLDEGWCLSSQDFRAGELVTWAASCLWSVGESKLADALNKKVDPHVQFACTMLGISLKDFDKSIRQHAILRQAGKPFNFTAPGSGGVPTIVFTQRNGGEDTPHPDGPSWIEDSDGNPVRGFKGTRFCTLMRGEYCSGKDGKNKRRTWGSGKYERPIKPTCASCLECGQYLMDQWKATWTEAPKYFKFVRNCVEHGMVIRPDYFDMWPSWNEVFTPWQQLEPQQIAQFWSGRIRKVGRTAEAPQCVLANGFFQGLLADVTKMAHRFAVRECKDATYRVPSMLFWNSKPSAFAGMVSPLLGSNIAIFAHDELIGEHPLSISHEASLRISELMEACFRFICPMLADAIEAEQTLMLAWSKAAAKVVHNDRVVPWTLDHDKNTCSECAAQKRVDALRKSAA